MKDLDWVQCPMANAFLRSRISWPRVGCQILVVGALLINARGRALAQSDCSILGQNTFVRDTLFDIYFWYRELPSTDPALFDSPEAYLEAVRFRPRDRSFSFIGSRAEIEAFFSQSQFVGFGFGTKQAPRREVRVTQVFAESPASEGGLERGAVLLAIDGRRVSELLENEEFGSAFGPNVIGVSVELTWRTVRGETRSAVLTKRAVTIPTVSDTSVFDLDGLPVGLPPFSKFRRTLDRRSRSCLPEIPGSGCDEFDPRPSVQRGRLGRRESALGGAHRRRKNEYEGFRRVLP